MTDALPANVRALHEQRDWLLVTLASIGDAVITTDGEERVTFLNPVAESLTGWAQEAVGQPLDGVIRLLNEDIEDLYSRVQLGTRVVVLAGKPPQHIANTGAQSPPAPAAPTNIAPPSSVGAQSNSAAAVTSSPLPPPVR